MEAVIFKRLILLAVGCVMFGGQATRVKKEDLLAHYEQYNGTSVIVAGEVASESEMTIMYLPSSLKDPDAEEGMLITLSEAISKKPGTLERRFIKTLKRANRVDAVLAGRFESAPDRRWGNQACCRFRLQVEHVLELK